MRVTRGLFASLGASGSMAAAGACALLAVSTAVGFRGWPGLSSGDVASQTLSAPAAQHHAPRERLGAPPRAAARRQRVTATAAARRSTAPRPSSSPAGRRTVRPAARTAPAPAAPTVGARPRNADLVLDMRFLQNPHWVPALRPLTGLEQEVAEHIAADPAYEDAMTRIEELLLALLPRYTATPSCSAVCTGASSHAATKTSRNAARCSAARPVVRPSWSP